MKSVNELLRAMNRSYDGYTSMIAVLHR